MGAAALHVCQHGAARYDRAALCMMTAFEDALATCPVERPGVRLRGNTILATLLTVEGSIGDIARDLIGADAFPVRAVLFDKTPGTNWALGWHQDRTIAVQERHELPGYGPWSVKAGITHVEPPFMLIEAMLTLRVHLDDVSEGNAPLLIAPGSHRLGRIPEGDLQTVVERCGTAMCLAERGDVWAYSTPIVHASAAASGAAHRRVLQVDYAAAGLPPPLAWLGIA